MKVEAGWLEMQSDGCLTGVLRTLTLNIQIELRLLDRGTPAAVYEGRVGGGWVMGEASMDAITRVIAIVIRSPELPSPMNLFAKQAASGNEWRMIWNPPSAW